MNKVFAFTQALILIALALSIFAFVVSGESEFINDIFGFAVVFALFIICKSSYRRWR